MSQSATLILVRHAHTECTKDGKRVLCGRFDAPLSCTGRAEVNELRRRLAMDPPASAVYSSPLRRALDTASAALADLRMRVRTLNSLAEMDCGSLDGIPLSVVMTEYAETWRRNSAQDDPDFRWPGGESYAQLRRRAQRAVRCVGSMHAGERVLLFTHAGVINQIIGGIVAQSPARWENYRPGNASITELRFDGARFEVLRFDDRTHLQTASTRQLF